MLNDKNLTENQVKKLKIREATCICNEDCFLIEVTFETKMVFYSFDKSAENNMNLNLLKRIRAFEDLDNFYLY